METNWLLPCRAFCHPYGNFLVGAWRKLPGELHTQRVQLQYHSELRALTHVLYDSWDLIPQQLHRNWSGSEVEMLCASDSMFGAYRLKGFGLGRACLSGLGLVFGPSGVGVGLVYVLMYECALLAVMGPQKPRSATRAALP